MTQRGDRRFGLDLQVKYAGMVWLLVAQIAVMLPYMTYLPIWLMLVLLACTAWRLRVLRGHWAQPSWLLKGGIIALGVVALVMSGIDPLSLDTMSSLLLLAFAFKALEVMLTSWQAALDKQVHLCPYAHRPRLRSDQ